MKLEPLSPPDTEKKTTSNADNLFDFGTNTSGKADFGDFSPFDTGDISSGINSGISSGTTNLVTGPKQGNNGAFGDEFGWDNPKSNVQSNNLFDDFGSNTVSGNGVNDLFGSFENDNNDFGFDSNNSEKIVTVKKRR